ncbi:putative plastid-lipid-associated protein [Dioscorea sansibarensis]
MASLFVSPHPPLFARNPNNPLLRFSIPKIPYSVARNPRHSSFSAVPNDGPDCDPENEPSSSFQRITDEWGEEAEPDPENEPSPSVPRITDEWGEEAELEPEVPSVPDPPQNEDEWGREPDLGKFYELRNGSPAPEENDKLRDLKRCLVDTFYGAELGFRASSEVRAEIFELVTQLEALNPTPAPTEAAELLDGNWVLLYTAFSELLPLLAVGAIPLLKIKKISQSIDSKSSTIVNATTLSSPFATFSFSASASFEVQTPSRIKVEFKEGSFQPPEISSTVDLPENIDVFGRKIDLLLVRQTLNPVQEAFANIARTLSGQPPLKVPIPGNRPGSWLLTTYLDKDLRISRGDGGLFVLAKEGSPLLDLLS